MDGVCAAGSGRQSLQVAGFSLRVALAGECEWAVWPNDPAGRYSVVEAADGVEVHDDVTPSAREPRGSRRTAVVRTPTNAWAHRSERSWRASSRASARRR